MKNKLYRILTVNSGSSSIKFSLYHMGQTERKILSGQTQGIGQKDSLFYVEDGQGKSLKQECKYMPDHAVALRAVFEWLKENKFDQDLDAVGHRVVHGGCKYSDPCLVTQQLIMNLRRLVPLAPEHLPRELDAIELIGQLYSSLKQIICFDTAFHQNMPQVARCYALPRYLWDEGVLRYGFHGLSYEYIVGELTSREDINSSGKRVVIAHLGHGASMAAVYNHQSIETTMGFAPTGGLVMSTRPGDLDPGVILYLLQEKRMTLPQMKETISQKAGLLGVSDTSHDMKKLLSQEKKDPRAALAINLFCYQAKKFLGALTAVLGGLDTLVFTGGIGENAPTVRWRICEGLEFMGCHIDFERNKVNAPVISRKDSPVKVLVIQTNEELVIARHTCRLLC